MLTRSSESADKSVTPVVKLRQLIRRKTSERDKLLKEIRQCEEALAPLRQCQREMSVLDREIHEHFAALLTNPKLSKRAKKEIHTLHEELQDEQVLSPSPARVAERASVCPCPACSGSADVAEVWPDGAGDPASDPGSERAASASRPPKSHEREASVRALYHKLALRFHPDRAEDETSRSEHESVMRKVNDAYHGGDTERLLDLGRELGIDVGELKDSDGLLAELVQQYERLKAEVRDIRNAPLGSLVAEIRRAEKRGYRSPLDELTEQVDIGLRQLTAVRDFVCAFSQGKINLKTFLEGPPCEDESELINEEEVFLDLFVRDHKRRSKKSARGT